MRQAGAREYPVAGLLDHEAGRVARAVPPAAAMAVACAARRVFRAPGAGGGPPVVLGAVLAALVAHHDRALVHQVDAPPAQVGAEQGQVAAAGDEVFDRVARGFAPVFVVAHADEQAVILQQRRLRMEVEVGGAAVGQVFGA